MRIESATLVSGGLWRFVGRIACIVTVWSFTAGANSCSSDESGQTFVTDLVLKTATGTVRNDFAPGEPITFELRVRNRRQAEAVVQFSSGQQFDFVVLDDGTNRVRWQWSRRRAFTQATTELVFAPGETKIFTVTWDQLDDADLPVGGSDYEARGVLLFAEFASDPLFPHQLGSLLRPLSIR
jgi:hypothetical protein